MSAPPLAILAVGMATGVGFSAPASCAAIRCGVNNFQETRFLTGASDWIMGSAVPFETPWRGRTRLVKLLAGPVQECLAILPELLLEQIPLLLCLAEPDRPGRLEGLDETLLRDLEAELDVSLHPESQAIARGRVGGAEALRQARSLLYRNYNRPEVVLVGGADCLLSGPTLREFEARQRLLTVDNSDGFIPGEAGSCLLVGRPDRLVEPGLLCLGLGFGHEDAPIESEEPLRGDGLTAAIKAALTEAGLTLGDLDYRLSDVSGGQYGFKEANLALARTLRQQKPAFDIWHTADCIGEVGAAVLPCLLGVALFAARKGYAPGAGVICQLGNDDGSRAAVVLRQAGGV
jgi:3-oxoacyl-[acyl-carrier-protein] synthase I